MASILHRSRHDDHELARRVGAGDSTAFAMLDARHRSALISYANTLLRRSEHDAEDVVQDVLIRVHDALRADDAPDELRPWLYRLTRNRAIDEVRRKRWGDEALDGDTTFAGDQRQDPETMLGRKEAMRRLVEDLAGLPPRQRTALLARARRPERRAGRRAARRQRPGGAQACGAGARESHQDARRPRRGMPRRARRPA